MSADKDCETAMEAGISASQIDGEFYRRLVDDSPVGLALVAIDGRWLKVNRALSELFGYSEHELSQLTFQQLTHAEDLEADLQHVQELLSGQRSTYRMEKQIGRASWRERGCKYV